MQYTICGQARATRWSLFRTLRTRAGESVAVGVGDHVSGETTRTRASAQAKQKDTYDVQSMSFNFLDSPATTLPLTYQIQVIGNGIADINREQNFVNNISTGNFISTITAWEIQG